MQIFLIQDLGQMTFIKALHKTYKNRFTLGNPGVNQCN